MRLEELIAREGRDRYRQACAWAWRTAAGTGHGEPHGWPDGLDDLPHALADAWYDDAVPLPERVDAAIRLYREMPCYANTIGFKHFYEDLAAPERERLWAEYRDALDDEDDRRADPVAYSLWVDFFEDQGTVEDAWREMTVEPHGKRLERVLAAAGPVPWALKEALFERLIRDPSWHPHIRDAIDASAGDVYGRLGPSAPEWLRRLRG